MFLVPQIIASNEVSATFSTGDVEAAVSLASEQLEAAQRGSDLMQAPKGSAPGNLD